MASSESEREDRVDILNVNPSQASEAARSSQNEERNDPLQSENEEHGGGGVDEELGDGVIQIQGGGGFGDVMVPENEFEVDADLVRVTKTKRGNIKVFFEGYW